MKQKLLFFFLIIGAFYSVHLCASELSKVRPTINILTWWGYLDKKWIPSYIQKKCNVNISFDEYYTNDEFQRRWLSQKNNYDIIIFEDTFYEVMRDEIKNKGNDVSDISEKYNIYIKNKYASKKYEPNVLYFFQSITGVLWNPKLIDIHKYHDAKSIFEAAHKNKIVLLDDPQIIHQFFESGFNEHNPYAKFNEFIKDKNVYISNDSAELFKSDDFAFSYVWSGDAIQTLGNNNFLIDSNFSYISSDLIAQVSHSHESECVMRTFSSKEFLKKLQNDTYYFSPYIDVKDISPGLYRDVYEKYLLNLPNLKWVDSALKNNYARENEEWKLIKLEIAK